jgi:hypothetical protein
LATSKRRNSIFLYKVLKDLNPPSDEFSEPGAARPVPEVETGPWKAKQNKSVWN